MDKQRRIIAISGGIGSGKSMVSKILSALGYWVYDCDSRAKLLMDRDVEIIGCIEREVCKAAVSDGVIDRKILGDFVFSSPEALKKLNSIVHEAVKDEILSLCAYREIAFVETAILYASGLDKIVDEVWEVIAPEEIRILRVLHRNPWLSEDDVRKRIEAQSTELNPENPHRCIKMIVNDGFTPLLPQIELNIN